MKATFLGAVAAAALAPGPAAANDQAPTPVEARLPGFASTLAGMPGIGGPQGWVRLPNVVAWAAIARATPETRQEARWRYALSMIGEGRAAEAFGALEVMRADDPDLQLVDSFRLARGTALAQMRRSTEAMAELIGPGLAANPEACLWRMVALAEGGLAREAIGQVDCALPALNARKAAARAPLVRIAARAAIEAGQARAALGWLSLLPRTDAAAELLRGRASAAAGDRAAALRHLVAAAKSGNAAQRIDAQLAQIELSAAGGSIDRKRALDQLARIRFSWRGGDVEERALRLSFRLADEAGDLRSALATGSTLLHYFDLGAEAQPLIRRLQAQLAAALAPGNGLRLEQAVSLYWDYRDLAPMGAGGDYLASQLGERLQFAGLYARAAELFEHQLFARAKDLAQGPLSVRVATLHILAGRPQRAIDAIRHTDGIDYPAPMRAGRRRVEAVALTQLGRTDEALAVLEDVPGGEALRTEILWKKRDWAALAAANGRSLPGAASLSEVDQAVVLRHAVALAMLRREADLAALRTRYEQAFAGLPSGPAFAALTSDVGSLDPAGVVEAMSAIPSASPAGDLADLLYAGAG